MLSIQRQPDSAGGTLMLLAVVLLVTADVRVDGLIATPWIRVPLLLAGARNAEQERRPAIQPRSAHKRSQKDFGAFGKVRRG